ncbi:cytochrome c1 [Marinicauda algicola]|uniref:Cytochrome c1 n=1 Tax=Marinicauda algicola TaxID=2029849 RepID=A0A4S2GX19_9PROT|nr:cytochrome c1 [Marinicauda algicola]TGY87583.1 cytochrome c1 [Marinicauda algicola]
MKLLNRLLVAAAGALALAAPGLAAEKAKEPEAHTWSWEGPFGQYDQAELQRGFQVYQQVCASCHALEYMSFRNLGEEGGPFFDPEYPNPNDNPVVRAIAADYMIVDGPDEFGEMFEREGRPADRFPSPFPNENAAAAANGGAVPPNLSLIVKARTGGAEYIRSLMLGYDYPVPEDVTVRPGQYYNPYFPGGVLAMPPQLMEGLVEYADGTEATPEQMAHDVTAFLAWAAEPHMEARKSLGFMVMIYLLIVCVLVWLAYRQVWSRVHH